MRIGFYGAAREVTGSKHLLEVNGKRILLDCGLFQGKRDESAEKNKNLMFDGSKIDAVILSHAHMDHAGDLPYLKKIGFNGPIFTTAATRDLCTHMLMDSAYIQQREVEYILRREGEVVEPLYGEIDAMETLKLMTTISYHRPTEIFPGVKLTFFDAGHILGSAITYLEIDDKDDGKRKTFTFTGDLGRKGLPILRDPEYIEQSDYLITETTYGNRFHKFIKEVDQYFEELINKTVKRGGKIIIPAFALERTQEVVYHLNLLTQQGRIPRIPVYVDSPLAVNVTQVFRSHPESFSKEVYYEFLKNGENPFGFGLLRYIQSVEDSKSLNMKKGPMIIISASGMMEHGRVLHHVKNSIEDPSNLILIVGYQAENTLGRKILDGEKNIKIFGDSHRVRAEVAVIDAFSGHADRSDLLDFISHIKGLKQTFLVHGEENQGLTFKDILEEVRPEVDTFVPMRGDVFDI